MRAYNRIILKLSGETLTTRGAGGCFTPARVDETAAVLKRLCEMGVETGVVIGGGNIWRGRFTDEMDPVNADQMGMLATVINALCLEDALTRAGCEAVTFTTQEMNRFARLYTVKAADECLKRGAVALFAGGSGHPFFTTDTPAALRAAELKADALFKGTNVDGVYSADPRVDPNARLLTEISYREAIERELNVMDLTAFTLCKKQRVPAIRVFSMEDLGNIIRVAEGENVGTLVHL